MYTILQWCDMAYNVVCDIFYDILTYICFIYAINMACDVVCDIFYDILTYICFIYEINKILRDISLLCYIPFVNNLNPDAL